MTTASARLFDELAKLATNAAGAAQGVRREIDTLVKAQVERVLGDLDVVQREEFEAVRDMAAKAREENDALKERLAALEARLGQTTPGGEAPAASGPAPAAANDTTTAAAIGDPPAAGV
jgi:BMFP domain-containing protein YqiC